MNPNDPQRGGAACHCAQAAHDARLIVVTGGPGAGKTALLETVRRDLCEHVAILPEAASIVFGGGFPRRDPASSRRAAQRAIYHVQRQLEREQLERDNTALLLCDRGTVDALAYWPGDPAELWRDVGSSLEAERARYALVLHLRTPPSSEYNHKNPLRVESAAEAARLDARIAEAWRGHPRLVTIEHQRRFVDKVRAAVAVLREALPACCTNGHERKR
jgi:predicted ATPase